MTAPSTLPRTAADHAFVTLITSDSYLPGALAQSAALNDLHPARRGGKFPSSIELEEESDPVPFTTVCLVTPETVSVGTIKQLRRTFDLVIGVEVIEGDRNAEEIRLLGRPDLHQTFTKLHILRLAQFASLVFLDADVLPLRPMSHLLNMVSSWPDDYFQGDGDGNTPATGPGDIPFLTASSVTKRNPHRLRNPAYPCPISAAPDSGWPDIFNSGVIVLAPPGERGFKEAMSMRSWDGGDQGTLNEWAGRQAGLASGQGTGGSGWNRLSFKYNVTPTAAYTYAPAYAKFGSGIHAVHFIGAAKPWSGLSFRPPFLTNRTTTGYDIGAYGATARNTPQSRETAYSYHILVDRWYAVYDAHFRAITDEDEGPKSEFEVRKYESAWEGGKGGSEFTAYDGGADSGAAEAPVDQPNQYPHVVPPHTYHVAAYSAASGQSVVASQPATLEELRRLALHGTGRADIARAGEGAYVSLPMEGRISLMRPPPPPPLPAPVPAPAPGPGPEPVPEPQPAEVHHYHHHEEHVETHAPPPPPAYHDHHHHEPPRPPSPPMIMWNPAVEPPPSAPPANTNNFPANAWYENQWDMPPTKGYHHGDEHHQQAPEQFFNPPEPEQYIPPKLVEEGHYAALTVNGAQPNQTLIKSVFPWEETERPPPTRAFPDAPPAPAPKAVEVAPEPEAPKPLPPPERPSSPPRTLGSTYYNAWDDIPSIQRYAARLTGARLPPSSKPVEPAATVSTPVGSQKEWAWERDRGDSGDASSRDGDDEEDAESSDSEEEKTPKALEPQTSKVATNGTSNASSKSPASSSSESLSGGSLPESVTTKDSSVPLAAPIQTLGATQASQLPNTPNTPLNSFELYLSERQKAQGALEGPKDIRHRLAIPGSGTLGLIRASGSKPQPPALIQTPTSDRPTIAGDDGTWLPRMAEPSFESSRISSFSSAISSSVVATLGSTLEILSHTQDASSESEFADDSSSTSSAGPSSPYELEPSNVPPLRTWDEARSVDAFKRDSHEVLARFLRQGTWGGRSPA
ncbi:Glycosyltransferase family 8 protein [Ceratobasidium theobromae]|uniref:Glycosyltransferase family 8 protein n=1 Tax=Ceratobasidium theobromae TaxID=1582974 RepID=A0A5N5QLM5_9AGAM|nr:Glycosyltransferase family 8 protein [Ceratobasidium theobromae]